MDASYYQNKDKKWIASISLGKDQFGKRKRKVFYGDTKSEVESKANTFIFEYTTGEYIEPNKKSFINFLNEYYDIYKSTWEDTTKSLYRMYIDVHFAPYFCDMKLADVKPVELDKFYREKMTKERTIKANVFGKTVDKTLKPMSINSAIKLNKFAKAAFNYAVKNNMIKVNPASRVSLGKPVKYSPKVYNEDQFLALLDVVSGKDDEVPIILGAGCGLRRGEIFGLKWKNVDLTKRTITIENTKVRFDKYTEKKPKTETSRRTIAAPQYVINVLRLHKVKSKKSQPDDYVITKWKPNAYSERFKKLLKDKDLPPIRLHDLRHYNAVIMMKRGISDKVAADRLGHANVSTLRKVYQHVLKDMDENAANEIDITFTNKNSQQASNT